MARGRECQLRELWQRMHEQRHATDEEALRLARADINRRLESMNELREQVSKERATFLPREVFDREHARMREELDSRIKLLENKDSNLQGRLVATGAFVALLVSLVTILIRFWK